MCPKVEYASFEDKELLRRKFQYLISFCSLLGIRKKKQIFFRQSIKFGRLDIKVRIILLSLLQKNSGNGWAGQASSMERRFESQAKKMI